jgi:hypothetical protein
MSPSLPRRKRLNSLSAQPVRVECSCYWPVLSAVDTAFKQQRLKAWQPILTPKAVLPTLFIIGLIFAPIGALIVWGSGKVTTITLDYTQCDTDAPTDGNAEAMPSNKYDCESDGQQNPAVADAGVDDLSTGSSMSSSSVNAPTWSFSNESSREVGQRAQCVIDFQVPYDLGSAASISASVFMLTTQDPECSCTTSSLISKSCFLSRICDTRWLTFQLPEP